MALDASYCAPTTLDGALDLLCKSDGAAVLLAGGTSLVKRMRRRPKTLIDLAKVGISGSSIDGDRLSLGAMVCISELNELGLAGGTGLSVLQIAGRRLASTFIRNAATLGGSSVACFRWSDLPAALLAANAAMVVRSCDEEREIPCEVFFERHPAALVRSGILTHIKIPINVEGGAAFTKFSPLTYGYAIWDAAVVVPAIGATSGNRVAVSAGVSLPRRLPTVEAFLDDGCGDIDELERVCASGLDELGVVGARTVSKEYRMAVGAVVVLDTIKQAWASRDGGEA